MDRYAKRFDAAEKEHLCNREGDWLEADQLGPASFKPEQPVLQAEGSDVDSLALKAEELQHGFGTEVFDACTMMMPRCMSKKPNIKDKNRAREKIRIEYKNDARQLKDILRGSVICETMGELVQCFAALQSLEGITILQVRASSLVNVLSGVHKF